jgi:hypothetical protein
VKNPAAVSAAVTAVQPVTLASRGARVLGLSLLSIDVSRASRASWQDYWSGREVLSVRAKWGDPRFQLFYAQLNGVDLLSGCGLDLLLLRRGQVNANALLLRHRDLLLN